MRLPSLKSREILRALEHAGFFVHHHTGSHAILRHRTDLSKRVTVPVHQGRDLPRGTLGGILKQAGLTPDEFAEHL